ncbi:MAG: hypothetical protein AB7I59_11830 [Geminicoccaceae bacterium]
MLGWLVPLVSIAISVGLVISALSGRFKSEPEIQTGLDLALELPSSAPRSTPPRTEPPAPGREFRPPAWIDPGFVHLPPDDGAAAGRVIPPPERYLGGMTDLR